MTDTVDLVNKKVLFHCIIKTEFVTVIYKMKKMECEQNVNFGLEW